MTMAEVGISEPQPSPHEEHRRTVDLPSGGSAVILVESRPVSHPEPQKPSSNDARDASASDDAPSGQSALNSVFTLCNSAIGAGVLSLPYAFRCAGAVGALLMCLALGSCEAFTLYVLSKAAERYKTQTYGTLIRKALGRKLAAVLSGIMCSYLFGSCIAYLIILGDTFSSLGAQVLGTASLMAQRRVIILGLGAGVILPMCLTKRLGALSFISAAAVAGFVYAASVIVYKGYQIVSSREDPFEDVQLFHWDLNALFAVPIIVFGFNCHANVVSIFSELSSEPDKLIGVLPSDPSMYRRLPNIAPRPRTQRLVNMIGVIFTAILLIMLGYLAVGLAGYLSYPTTVSSNILNVLPKDDILVQVARGFIGLVVLGHYPLSHHPARTGMMDALVLLGYKNHPPLLSLVFTLLFVCSTMAVAMVVTDLGAVLHIIGGTAASFMIFFLPGLLLVNAAIMKHSSSVLESLNNQDSEAAATNVNTPLLQAAAKQGIKKSGLIYSPGKSWAAGIFLISLSVVIFSITVTTSLVH